MRNLDRNKRKLYVCEVYQGGDRNKQKLYHEPIELYENWQEMSTSAEFMNIGLETFDYARIKTSKNHAQYYHLGDRLYIKVTPPEIHDEFCKTADYEVYQNPIVTLNECSVVLRKLSGRHTNNIY